jgi:enamine deaminase RidA (YjgF/YER057c/UK114 family)
MSEIQRVHVGPRYSEGSAYAGIIFLAGQVASSTAGDIKAQTAEVLSSIDQLLAEAGSSKARVLMAQIFLSDMAEYGGMNEVWDAWVVPGHTPSRATVQAQLARPEWKIEIVVTAARA